MFGLSLTHMILFGIIALIFIGPEQLPEVARTIGRMLNELRRATQDFQGQFTGQFKDQKNEFNEIRHQITNVMHEPDPQPNYAHHDKPGEEHLAHTGHGPEAHQGHDPHRHADHGHADHGHSDHGHHHGPESADAQADAAAASADTLPAGAHPVSEDAKGKKS